MVFSESLDTTTQPHPRTLAVDLHVGGAHSSPVDVFLEELISWAVDRSGIDDCVKAKEEFFQLTGKVFYDDETYHSRMHYFLEYFLFERTIQAKLPSQVESTPFETYLDSFEDCVISGFTHSLFKVARIHNNGMSIKDLFSGQKFKIHKQESEIFKGIFKGDIFQGFIFHLREYSVLGKGLIFHPLQAHRYLKKSIKEDKNNGFWNPNQILTRLARQQLKHARLKHVNPKLVYLDTTT